MIVACPRWDLFARRFALFIPPRPMPALRLIAPFLLLLLLSKSGLRGGERAKTQWTRQSVKAELKAFEAALKRTGLKSPMKRALELAAQEKDWDAAQVQQRWQSRIDYWRDVLLDNKSWGEVLDATSSSFKPLKAALDAGDESADKAWARYLTERPGIPGAMASVAYQKLLFEAYAWTQFRDDGSFLFDRADELIESKVRLLNLEPVQLDADRDYDWFVKHERDRLFYIMHQNQWHTMCLGLAQLHRPDDKWVRQWVRLTMAHIDQCPRLPNGQSDGAALTPSQNNASWSFYGYVANRLRYLLLNYLAMKDSPVLTPRLHAVVLRMIQAHVQHLDSLGVAAYSGNYCSATGKALFLTAMLMPEIRVSDQFVERMFQHLQRALGKELLSDGCHVHRSFSYHQTFVERPLSMILAAKKTGRTSDVPRDFLKTIENATDAFALMSTPIRSTPGINDDWTVAVSSADLVGLAAGAFDREDWLHLATDGKSGQPPHKLSCLLPKAQVLAMRSDWSRQARYLFFNVSPDGGHHHADTLSIQIWSGGRHLLIDPGVGHYYTGDLAIARRSWWHNCPTFGQQQLPNNPDPEILHWALSPDLDYAIGQITIGSATIRRHVFFVEQQYFVLWDELLNLPPAGELWENFHFAVKRDEIEVRDEGRFVRTTLPEGTNLALVSGQPRWVLNREEASKWLTYGGKPIPTALLHFRATSEVAGRGFAALLIPFKDETELRQTSVDRVERLTDGRVRLHITRLGKRKALTTERFND